MKFSKYIGAGNDFLIFDNRDLKLKDLSEITKNVCDRHFGLGADGSLFVETSSEADIKMRYFNSDGSEGEMCGNGIRAFTKYVYDEGIVRKMNVRIETLAGIKEVKILSLKDGKTLEMEVDMGVGEFNPKYIPVDLDMDIVLNEELNIGDEVFKYSAVLVGVPHVVIFIEDILSVDINKIGKSIENHKLFPRKTNVNFIEVESRDKINIYTWERGAGRTLGCGTGSCSSVLVGNKLGLLDDKVEVQTEGGRLKIELDGDNIRMIGSADLIATGEINTL